MKETKLSGGNFRREQEKGSEPQAQEELREGGTSGGHLVQPAPAQVGQPRAGYSQLCLASSSLALANERLSLRRIIAAVSPHPRDATGHNPFLNHFHTVSFMKSSTFL